MKRTLRLKLAIASLVALFAFSPAGFAGGAFIENSCACGGSNWYRFYDWQQYHWDCFDAEGGTYIHGC